jgi:uncharacterized membrane protein
MKFNLSIAILFFTIYIVNSPIQHQEDLLYKNIIVTSEKKAALTILQNHCNECHQHKKKKYVFTEDNMTSFATKIHQQVFVKKKMPKGNNFLLSKKDETILLEWLTTEISIGN